MMPPVLRVVLAALVLMAAVAGGVGIGVRWGAPSYVAVKADRGVLIVNRFTGQAWSVRGRTKYVVETEQEQAQALPAEGNAEAKRTAAREADVNRILEHLLQESVDKERERTTAR